MKVTLLTNGPGELWGWARPVIQELSRRGHSVSLWLLPCPFASGYERMAASQLGVDKLEGPGGSVWTWRALGQEKTDCVLQLGGDLLFGRRLARRSNAPLLCYAYGFKKGMERARVFTAYPGMAKNIDARRQGTPGARVIGDLVKDSLALDRAAGAAEAGTADNLRWNRGPRLLLFPGSRPDIRSRSLRWAPVIIRLLRERIPDLQIGTFFSPFTPESEFSLWVEMGLNPLKTGAKAAMERADYALTQPGTNTLELMHYGLPALVAVPADFLKDIPVSGLGGLVTGLPWAGSKIKEWVIRRSLRRYSGFISWPNRIARRTVLDEVTGDLTPEDLADRVAASLEDKAKLARVRGELLALSGSGGAAVRLCDAVEESGAERQTRISPR